MGSILQNFRPTLKATFSLTATHRFAIRDHYDDSGNYFKGSILETPTLQRELSDIFYGVEDARSVTLRLANVGSNVSGDSTWDEIVANEEIRGKWVTLERHDPVDGTNFEFRGKISSFEIGDRVEICLDMIDDDILDTLLPQGVVTPGTFSTTALGVGAPINIPLGHCRNLPLANIQNDTTNNYYDYLVGYADGGIEGIWDDAANGYGVRRDGVLVDTSEYTFFDGTQATFSGFAFIRFTTEQKNFSGGYHSLTADVKGLKLGEASAQRNFIRCIEHFFSNATWGLNDSIDAGTFASAADDLDTIGNLYCDGAITSQRKARDILNDLLYPARAFVTRASDGEWEITVDKAGSSVANFGDGDGFYNNCEVLSVSAIPAHQAIKTAKAHYAPISPGGDAEKEMSTAVHSTFGEVKTIDLPFVFEDDTAERVLSYIKNRSLHSSWA